MPGFKTRFVQNVLKVHPWIAFRIIATAFLVSPLLISALIRSWFKLRKWRKPEVCRAFIRQYPQAFAEIDESTLEVFSKAGGVNNANQVWKCRNRRGEEVSYFVKIFVPVGSFWARHMSIVSPFPAIDKANTHERFTVDLVSRVDLAAHGVPVPKLMAFDPHDQVMVTEYLKGENLDEMFKRMAPYQEIPHREREVIRQCGIGLAKIHKGGFSLIDTQPVNCIWVESEDKVYFTDLEFCTRRDQKIWDVGFFLCFTAIRLNAELAHQVRELFLESYQKERKIDLSKVRQTRQLLREYFPIFQTILDIRQYTPEALFEELIRN